jgi:hypothetical protein
LIGWHHPITSCNVGSIFISVMTIMHIESVEETDE